MDIRTFFLLELLGIIIALIGVVRILARASLAKRDNTVVPGIIDSIEILKKRDRATTWVERVPTIKYTFKKKTYRKAYYCSKAFRADELRIGQRVTVSFSDELPEFIRVLEFEPQNNRDCYVYILAGVGVCVISAAANGLL